MNAQETAIKAILELEEKELVIAGPAGTGKSWVIIQAVKGLINDNKSVVIACTTYKALNRISKELGKHPNITYKSIASLLGQTPHVDISTGLMYFEGDPNRPQEDVVILDEASMIDQTNLRELRQLGKPLVLVGDPYQLPPVKSEESPAFKGKNRIDLVTIHRQEKGPLLEFLTACRSHIEKGLKKKINPDLINGEIPGDKAEVRKGYRPSLKWLQKLEEGVYDPEEYKILCFTNANAAYHNSECRKIHKGAPAGYEVGEDLINGNPIIRRVNIEGEWQDKILAPASTDLKVMQKPRPVMRNGYEAMELELGLFKPVYVLNPGDQLKHEEQLKWLKKTAIKLKTSKAWRDYYMEKNAFDDIRYTYALTVHRAQGSQYTEGYIEGMDLKKCRSIETFNRLWYTAATRFKTGFIYSY